MTLTTDIFAKLSTTAAITAILGTAPTRAFPLRVPESVSTYPALTFQLVSPEGEPVHTHDAYPLVTPRGRRVQFTLYDTDSTRCWASMATIRDALLGRSTWGGNEASVRLASEGQDVDPEPRGLYRAITDLYIMTAAP